LNVTQAEAKAKSKRLYCFYTWT